MLSATCCPSITGSTLIVKSAHEATARICSVIRHGVAGFDLPTSNILGRSLNQSDDLQLHRCRYYPHLDQVNIR